MSLLISDVICQPQCHFLFQMSSSTTMSLLILDVTCQSQCHSLFQMSFVNHDVTPYFQVSQGYQVAFGRSPTAWYRNISMATSEAPPLGKRSLLRGSVTCNVRVWSCRKYRVKTPALLEGGQRWMLHVSINNKHIKTIFDKQSICMLLLQRPCNKKLYAIW